LAEICGLRNTWPARSAQFQLLRCGILHHEPDRATIQRIAHVGGIVVHGHHHHPGTGRAQADVASASRPVRPREVHQHHVRCVLQGQLQCLFGVAGLGDELHVGKPCSSRARPARTRCDRRR
jgi:hypothetical protein